jgi:hypothetical protein
MNSLGVSIKCVRSGEVYGCHNVRICRDDKDDTSVQMRNTGQNIIQKMLYHYGKGIVGLSSGSDLIVNVSRMHDYGYIYDFYLLSP